MAAVALESRVPVTFPARMGNAQQQSGLLCCTRKIRMGCAGQDLGNNVAAMVLGSTAFITFPAQVGIRTGRQTTAAMLALLSLSEKGCMGCAGADLGKIVAIVALGMPASLIFTAQVAVAIRKLVETKLEDTPTPKKLPPFKRFHYSLWGESRLVIACLISLVFFRVPGCDTDSTMLSICSCTEGRRSCRRSSCWQLHSWYT